MTSYSDEGNLALRQHVDLFQHLHIWVRAVSIGASQPAPYAHVVQGLGI
jgi:hypothetical protein